LTLPTTGLTSSQAQQQAGNIARQGGNANRAWDIDEVLFTSHGAADPKGSCEPFQGAQCVTDGVMGRLATDRPHVVNFYAGSGTPLTTYVVTLNQTNVFVEGRGDMGRTPMLNRTDLLLSHELGLGSKRMRFELNVQNIFNQKTATHVFNYLNRGAGAARASSGINLSRTDLTKGYDYNALIRATPDGANAYDPRYGKESLFQTGTQGQFSVKFIF
jgi:hypothetical protein